MTDRQFSPIRLIAVTIFVTLASAAVAGAQSNFSKVFIPNVIGPGSVSTALFTITNGTGGPVTGLAFTDVLPAAITIADPANASTDCNLSLTGTLTAPDGGSTITLSDAQIGISEVCTVTVDVTAGTPGVHTNPSITLSSSAGSSMSLPIDLTVVTTLPGFSKSFAPSSVGLGGRSTLTLTIDNSANASNVLNLDFTDNLPVGMTIADPANASTTCGTAVLPPTLTATSGASVIILDADGTLAFPAVAAGATCTVIVDVVTSAAGELDNVTGELLATSVSSGRASATLDVTVTPLAIRKSFTDDPVPPGGTATLEFTIDNFDRFDSATGVAFTDDLTTLVPALPGLTFDSLMSNDCGGSVSGVGGTTIGFTGGTLAPESSCTLRVSLAVPAGATAGAYTNTTSTITATVGGSPVVGNMASDYLYVEPVPLLTKEFLEDGTLLPDPVINAGDDVVIRFTITNSSTTSMATEISFGDELTDAGPGTGFLPFPVTVTLPPVPDPPCGAGSSLALVSFGTDRQGLELTGGSLEAAPGPGDSCTFDVTVSIPDTLAPGAYLNTTEEITATVDGGTRTGEPGSDTLTVIAAPTLTKSFTDDPVAPGDTVTLEFSLTHSPSAATDATGISFTDDLTSLAPPLAGLTATGLPLVEACDPDGAGGDSGTGTLSESGGVLTFMGGTLSPGETCVFTVTLNVPGAAASGVYANTTSGVGATVSGKAATSSPASADLDVGGMIFSKEFLGDPAFPGKALTLRFTLENISAVTATGIGFTDSLFSVAGLVATDPALADDCGGTLTILTIPMLGSFLTYAGGTLNAGATCNLDVEVTVPITASDGVYENFVSGVSYMLGATPGFDGPAIDDLTVDSDQLSLLKAFTDDPVSPGDSVTLEFTLTNLDPDNAASDIDFTDDLGAALSGLTFDSVLFDDCGGMVSGTGTDMVTVTGASLIAGGACTLRVSLSVPGAAAADIYTNTTSAVTGAIGGFAVTGDAASDDLEVIQLLQFSKSFDGPTTATGMATLTFTITNPGTDTATGISFSDDLDAVISGLIAISLPAVPCGAGSSITGIGFLTFSGGELPPMGGMCSFDVDVLVPATATAGTFPNTTSDLFQAGLVAADPATADLTIEPPPTFAKVFMPDAILAGGFSTLRFTINNSASAVTALSLDFTDNLPAGAFVATPSVTANTCGGTLTATAGASVISMTGGSVGAGASCTVDVDVTSVVAGMFANTSGDLTSSSGSSGTASDTLTVTPAADLSVSKSDGVTSATPGGSVVYTIVATNNGPSTDPSVTLSDTFPSPPLTCTYTSMAAGGATGSTAGAGNLAETLSMPALSSVTYTVSCDIDADATGTLSNTATVTASVTDHVPGNNSATDGDTVLAPSADLAITKTAPTGPVVDPTFTYTLEVTNDGPSEATGVEATDVLPAGVVFDSSPDGCTEAGGTVTCPFGTLADGATMTRTFDVALDPPWAASIINTATVSSDNSDPNLGNNDSTVETALDAVPPETTEVATAAGPLAGCDTVRDPITSITVTIADDLAPGTSAGDPANYLLVGAGPDAYFSTGFCAGGAAGDDVPIEIVSLSLTTVDPLTVTARLGLGGELDPGLYRLLVCDTITDAAGNVLDGDGDTNPGGDFVLPFFRSDPRNLFANGHFDDCPVTLDPWMIWMTAPNAVLPGTPAVDDSEVSPFSASARVYNSTADPAVIAQCVPVNSSSGLDLRARVRFTTATSAVATFGMTCEFFEGGACGGASLGVASEISLLEDEGGTWLFLATDMATPVGTASALCDFTVEAVGASSDFDLYLDGLYIGSGSEIFSDGFESGDVSAWSSSTP